MGEIFITDAYQIGNTRGTGRQFSIDRPLWLPLLPYQILLLIFGVIAAAVGKPLAFADVSQSSSQFRFSFSDGHTSLSKARNLSMLHL